jgi:hypothetical protein
MATRIHMGTDLTTGGSIILVSVEDGECNEHQEIVNVSHSHDRRCQLHRHPKYEIYTIGRWHRMQIYHVDIGAR